MSKMSKPGEQKNSSHPPVLEELWSLIGGFGRYPVLLNVFMSHVAVVTIFQHFILIYYGAPPDYQCVSNEMNGSSSCGINQCGCVNCTYVFMTDEFSSAASEVGSGLNTQHGMN